MATLISLQSNFSSKHTAVSRLYKLFLACLISSFILSGVPFVFYFGHHAAMAASASKTAGPVETYLLQFAPNTSEMERAQVLAEMNAVQSRDAPALGAALLGHGGHVLRNLAACLWHPRARGTPPPELAMDELGASFPHWRLAR